MRRMQVRRERRTTDLRPASPVIQPQPLDCRDLDVVRAKELQRERKC
jgi:hypothetical protein